MISRRTRVMIALTGLLVCPCPLSPSATAGVRLGQRRRVPPARRVVPARRGLRLLAGDPERLHQLGPQRLRGPQRRPRLPAAAQRPDEPDLLGLLLPGEHDQLLSRLRGQLQQPDPARHDLGIGSATVGVVFHLLPRGAAIQPYVGGGGGAYVWRLQERGDFIDFESAGDPIFSARLTSNGTAFGYFGLVGLKAPITRNVSIFAEGRWTVWTTIFRTTSRASASSTSAAASSPPASPGACNPSSPRSPAVRRRAVSPAPSVNPEAGRSIPREDSPPPARRGDRGGSAAGRARCRGRVPVLRIAERDLLEADAVAPVGGADVEVAVDHGLGAVADVPVLGEAGAAPDREARDARQHGEILAQREVVDDHQRRRARAASASRGSVEADALVAPGRRVGEGVGVEEHLVRAEEVLLGRPRRSPRRPGCRRAGRCSRRAGRVGARMQRCPSPGQVT